MNFLNASRNPERGNPAESLKSGQSETVLRCGRSSAQKRPFAFLGAPNITVNRD